MPACSRSCGDENVRSVGARDSDVGFAARDTIREMRGKAAGVVGVVGGTKMWRRTGGATFLNERETTRS
jgi:hypothetical protein